MSSCSRSCSAASRWSRSSPACRDEPLRPDPQAGRTAIERHGCTSCHAIPGLREPEARVGPPLADLAARRYIAGDEPNTPDVLVRWLQDPQAIEPGTLMPDVDVSPDEARDIAAYLHGQR